MSLPAKLPVVRKAATAAELDKVKPHLTKAELQDMSHIGFKVFMALKEEWGLSPMQCMQLLGLEESNRSTWNLWQARFKEGREAALFDRDRLERLSHLAQIYRGVTSAFPEDRHGLGWLLAPNANPVFQGRPPLAVMLDGRIQDLATVQSYLEAVLMSHAG